MSVRPRSGVEVPALTARIARASNPEGTTAMWVRDRLDGLWSDEDFVTAVPLIVARFTKGQCQPCPVRAQCTSSRDGARNVGFPPRELRDLQVRVRAEQQTPDWKARYAVRSGVEGTMNEFAHGHGMRRCRYRGEPKAHLQHILTAIAVNIERLSARSDTMETCPARSPTAFQAFLDQQGIHRSKSWRTLGT